MEAPGTTVADMTVSVSTNELQACVARAEVLTRAIGFRMSSPLPTTQSRAFFNAPGAPCAYSGAEIRTASHVPSWLRNLLTAAGVLFSSRSGLKAGSSARASKIEM